MDGAFAELAGRAAESRRREPVGLLAPLLLDAAFLVRRGQAAGFEKTVERWANRLADRACEVTLTGPWPPYNFIGGDGEPVTELELAEPAQSSLLDLVDNLLNQGVVIPGEVVIGLAGVDLIYLRLSALLCAADRVLPPKPTE